jgi:hypothetical protein
MDAFRLRAATAAIRACGICFDVFVENCDVKKTDAIQCRLEQENGEAVNVFVPYSKKLFGRIQYGEVFATAGERDIFPQSQGIDEP